MSFRNEIRSPKSSLNMFWVLIIVKHFYKNCDNETRGLTTLKVKLTSKSFTPPVCLSEHVCTYQLRANLSRQGSRTPSTRPRLRSHIKITYLFRICSKPVRACMNVCIAYVILFPCTTFLLSQLWIDISRLCKVLFYMNMEYWWSKDRFRKYWQSLKSAWSRQKDSHTDF